MANKSSGRCPVLVCFPLAGLCMSSTGLPSGLIQRAETMVCNVLGMSPGSDVCCLITGKLFIITGNTEIVP